MNYLFGKWNSQNLDEKLVHQLIRDARQKKTKFSQTPISQIISVLGKLSQVWNKNGNYYQQALTILAREGTFSSEMTEATLDLISEIFSEKNLRARVAAEFGNPAVLDSFSVTPPSPIPLKAIPRGILLHVSAGNVFLGCVDSLVNGFLTKNISIVKLSSKNREFPRLFAESLLQVDSEQILSPFFALAHWVGGSQSIENIFKKESDAIICWGGSEMVQSYRQGLGNHVTLLEHGPKISFQVITRKSVEKIDLLAVNSLAERIARDVSLWDQSACASPQNLFLEKGIDTQMFMDAIEKALDRFHLPRATLDDDTEVELLKEFHRAQYSALTTENAKVNRGNQWMVEYDPKPGLRVSPLSRTLIIKEFSSLEDFQSQLYPISNYLQSCGIEAEKNEKEPFLNMLAQLGVQRFTKIGSMLDGAIGAPHDGRFSLHELVRFVPDESKPDLLSFVNEANQNVPFYRDIYQNKIIYSVSDLKPISGSDFSKAFSEAPSPQDCSLFLPGPREGYYFSSGGTSGAPKFVFFTHDEFQQVGKMLATGLQAQGIQPHDVCANLFVAGNLWSSFLAIEKALAHLGAVQLPIGGNAASDLILEYLERFKPRVVFGLPSMLADLAQKTTNPLSIPIVAYAGEHLNAQTRALLKRVWKTEHFFSAGYASVDAGPIGYQCKYCDDREHHIFQEVHLEIIEQEAVITSLLRKVNPIIHLKTGDRVEWSSKQEQEFCPCGSHDRKFILHGRLDGQINFLASRIQLSEIEHGILSAGILAPIFQVRVQDEEIEIALESEDNIDEITAIHGVYEHCKDLKITQSFDTVRSRIRLNVVKPGCIPRVERTGKIKSILDMRVI